MESMCFNLSYQDSAFRIRHLMARSLKALGVQHIGFCKNSGTGFRNRFDECLVFLDPLG